MIMVLYAANSKLIAEAHSVQQSTDDNRGFKTVKSRALFLCNSGLETFEWSRKFWVLCNHWTSCWLTSGAACLCSGCPIYEKWQWISRGLVHIVSVWVQPSLRNYIYDKDLAAFDLMHTWIIAQQTCLEFCFFATFWTKRCVVIRNNSRTIVCHSAAMFLCTIAV
jgi:hypothetical protein